MLDCVRRYADPQQQMVIHNGRTSTLFDSKEPKQDFVLSVGRVWDQAKQVSLLLAAKMPGRTRIVGWEREPGRESKEALLQAHGNIELLGPESQDELRSLFAHASIYAATSRYEPFGLAPLEAALSRCALVMNDNPVFHELWGDTALFFQSNDPADMARVIAEVRANPELRDEYGERSYKRACETFTAEQMVEQYEGAYNEICSRTRVA
jgi:glycosyltransferase involved in cell wall biosynthesis